MARKRSLMMWPPSMCWPCRCCACALRQRGRAVPVETNDLSARSFPVQNSEFSTFLLRIVVFFEVRTVPVDGRSSLHAQAFGSARRNQILAPGMPQLTSSPLLAKTCSPHRTFSTLSSKTRRQMKLKKSEVPVRAMFRSAKSLGDGMKLQHWNPSRTRKDGVQDRLNSLARL